MFFSLVHCFMSVSNRIRQLPNRHGYFIVGLSLLVLLLLVIPTEKASASREGAEQLMYHLGVVYPLPLELEVEEHAKKPAPEVEFRRETIGVRSGDSLALIFNRAGFSATTLYQIDNLGGDAHKLRRIHPGEDLEFISNAGRLVGLRYPYSSTETLVISRIGGKFNADIETLTLETRTKFARADIVSNFWNAGVNAGLGAGQIMDLATIFGWDVDFALDIRQGDSFAVLYEEEYADGEFVRTGNIVAAEFVNAGETFQAVRYTDGAYYTPQGKAMRKAFLRAPVSFKYISSSFNPNRRHPVTGKVRAHRGIDYAARTGTPVEAAGNGRVIASSYNKYNGNYVFIKHSERYVTKYLHLSKRNVKKGQRVKQGDLIGKVGATGRVTGAHLHYEFLVNGVHKNPRTVKLPQAQSLKKSEREQFVMMAESTFDVLEGNKSLMLALR